MTSSDRYLQEFPDYDGDLPDLFDLGFTDQSDSEDHCPRLDGPGNIRVWCDFVDQSLREHDIVECRFTVEDTNSDIAGGVLLETDDESELRTFLETIMPVMIDIPLEFAERCRDRRTTPAKVLKGFIADLCGLEGEDYHNHGSNEREAARAWFNLIPWHIYKK